MAVGDRLRALRVVHPFPSSINVALVVALALAAGADAARAALLGGGMLGLQFCIGATNDIVDRDLDRRTKPAKPIPSGLVSVRIARAVAVAAGVIGLGLAVLVSPVAAVLALAMLGCGLAYDLRLKPTLWAWACFSLAFALLPIYAWYGAVGTLPPRAEILIPLAAIAGPALQLSNGLVDIERDAAAGIATLATGLGRRRALLVVTGLLVLVHGLAWVSLALDGRPVNVLLAVGSLLAVTGLALSARRPTLAREAGWSSQAIAIALLGWGWLLAVR